MTVLNDSHDHTLTLPVTAPAPGTPATLVADRVSAWFGDHQVLDDVTLTMPAGRVTALIGPSGCGKSTFLRILNRMHELVPGSGLAGEVRLDDPGASLSGGQQQRLCIARALAVRPDVLLMDEPCSALDPTSTRRVEETIRAIADEVTVVIVTHNMQQAQRVSDRCAFFLAAEGTPGHIVEQGDTSEIFERPQDSRTADYVNGRFG